MKRSSLALVVLFIVALLPAAASSSTGRITVLKTRGYVRQIAADGFRVAAATNGFARDCDRIVVWNPVKKTIATVNTSVNCSIDRSGINEVPELAIAGNRVAWLEAVGGNNLDLTVKTFVLGTRKTLTVSSFVENGFGAGETPDGDWIGGVAGHGSLLVYDRWTLCTALPSTVTNPGDYGDHCDQPASGDHQDYVFSNQKLLEIVGGKSVVIASAANAEASLDIVRPLISPHSLAVVSVDAGRIATQDASGKVTIYSAKGAELKQIAVPSDGFAGTVLQSSRLVTLRNGKLELYNVNSGALVKTIPLAAGSVLRDLQGGLAVSVRGRKVQVIRLSSGKRLTFSPPGTGSVDAQIEASGLFYSYNYKNSRDHGRIVFVPYARLVKKLG